MEEFAPEPILDQVALEERKDEIERACRDGWASDDVLLDEDDVPDLDLLIDPLLRALAVPQPVDAGIDDGIAAAAVAAASGEQSLGTVTRQILHVEDAVAAAIIGVVPLNEVGEFLNRLRVAVGYLIGAVGTARLQRANLEASRSRVTGLLSKDAFYADVRRAADAVAGGEERTLVAIDMDGLKAINDNQGHPAGDAALRALAAALQRAVEGNGTAYHLSGDEFALIVRGSQETLVNEIVQAAVEAEAPSFSFGSLILDETARDAEPEDLYHEADIRMLEQKRAKRAARD